MSQRTLRCFPVAIAVALALSGCGGGGSATKPDGTTGMTGGTGTGTGMTGDTDTGMTGGTGTGTGTGTGMTGGTGTDTGMTGGGQTLTAPEGLARSTVSPLFYDENITDADRGPLFTVPTVASGIRRDYDEQRSGFANDAYIKSLGFADVADDDGIPFSLHVTYVVGGEEVTLQFTDADRDDPNSDFSWTKTIDGVEYWGWLYGGNGAQEDAIGFISGIPGYRLYSTGGIRTEAADLPSGTAVYEGGMRADAHLTNDPSRSGRETMSGSLRLTANFDAASLEGRISDLRVRPEPPRPRVWSSLPDTTWLKIDNGRIVDGQFTADLTGMDSNATAPMNRTVRGYEGGVLGEFYGPEAEEVGGVLNASRDDRVMAGVFGGKMTRDPGTGMTGGTGTGTGMTGGTGTGTGMTGGGQTLTVPEGLVRSTATPVYATDADSYRSAGLETHYPVLSSEMVRNWNDSTVTLGSDVSVESIAGDAEAASGNVEIVVTYELDDGEEATVSFTDDDFETDDGLWTKEIDGITHGFWFGNDSFRHFSTIGSDACGGGSCLWTYSSIGARTDSAHMPAGSATYYGTARADSYLKDEPGQPHIKLLSHQQLTAIVIIEPSPNALLPDTDFRILALEKIHRHMPNHSEIMGCITSTNPTLIFTKRHVQSPMQSILNPPMGTHRLVKQLHLIKRCDVVALFPAHLPFAMTFRLHHPDRFQSDPSFADRQMTQVGGQEIAPVLHPTMTLVRRFFILNLRPFEILLLRRLEISPELSRQLLLVVLHRQDVIPTSFVDLLRDLSLATHRIHGHDAPLQFQLLQQFRDRRNLV